MSINFATLQGLVIPEGVVTQIVDQYGNILMQAGGWTDDLDTGLEFKSTSRFVISVSRRQWNGAMEYCNSEDGWKTWTGSAIAAGEFRGQYYLYVRGRNNTKITGAENAQYAWSLSVQDSAAGVECNGNIENLLNYQTVQQGSNPTMANYCFTYLFNKWTNLITAPSLPATTLSLRCYNRMFQECSRLAIPPSLPAITLAESCYDMMFYMCTGLMTAPSLPATTLAKNCYWGMFHGCTSLELPPSLPATTIAYGCYQRMFYACTNLIGVTNLPATTQQTYCYKEMFSGCTSIKLSTTSSDEYTTRYTVPSNPPAQFSSTNLQNMFYNTGGSFKGTPQQNRVYFLHSSNVIV